jgi:hypothetical protein
VLAPARWLLDDGRDDEAAAVRAFWPAFRDNVVEAGVSLDETLRQVAWHRKVLGRRVRAVGPEAGPK